MARVAPIPIPAAPAGQPSTKNGITPATPLTGKKTKRNLFIADGIFACLAVFCAAFVILFVLPTSSVEGTVTDLHWKTNVPVEEVRAVDYSNERGNPPSGAYNVSCRNESRDVCEQKTIDKSNGYSEVVEECYTETEQYCSYTVDEWQTIQTYTLEGSDLQPIYDDPNLASNQRIGNKTEEFTVTFATEKGTEVYSPDSISEYQQFSIGSTWTLKMNLAGGVLPGSVYEGKKAAVRDTPDDRFYPVGRHSRWFSSPSRPAITISKKSFR